MDADMLSTATRLCGVVNDCDKELVKVQEQPIATKRSRRKKSKLKELRDETIQKMMSDYKRERNTVLVWVRKVASGQELGPRGARGVQKGQLLTLADEIVKAIHADTGLQDTEIRRRVMELCENIGKSETRTVQRHVKSIMKLIDPYLTTRKAQINTALRVEAADSKMNLVAYYSVAKSMGMDTLPAAAKWNTDKTVLLYNNAKGKVLFVMVPKGTRHVHIQKTFKAHNPQRIDLLKTISADGVQGPPILLKRIPELRGEHIWKVKFKKGILTNHGLLDNGGEVWFYGRKVKQKAIFFEYYTRILPPLIQQATNNIPLTVKEEPLL